MREGDVSQGRRLNIRLSCKDLEAIQKRALAEGLPYQTLISSLLHKIRIRSAERGAIREGRGSSWPRLSPENADRRHSCGDSRRKSQAFAKAHSRSTVAGDIPNASAASSMLNPAKNRSSTTWLCRASIEASAASA